MKYLNSSIQHPLEWNILHRFITLLWCFTRINLPHSHAKHSPANLEQIRAQTNRENGENEKDSENVLY